MELKKRKPTRLAEFDYSSAGAYFVTVCTKDRKHLLCNIVGEGLRALPTIQLTKIGDDVENAIRHMNHTYPDVCVDKYVIMPNHIHMIIKIEPNAGGLGDPPLQDIIGRFKSYTTHKFCDVLWQRSFYDHIIRNEQDYLEIWQYIDNNPAKWEEDEFY